jgi:hypothetical protein
MIKKLRWFLLFGLFQILVSGVYAAVPSWQNYVVYVEGVETQGEADAITEAISGSDPKMIKSVDGLTPKSGQVFIHHDHHNTRLNSLVQAAKQLKPNFRFYVKMEIPDYQKVQGTLIGDKLQAILDDSSNGIRCDLIDKKLGLFHVVFHGQPLGEGKRGFNMGDLAHPISDPVIFRGLGLNMNYLGVDGKGGMVKNAITKEMQFLKNGKKPKPYAAELMAAYKQLFEYPTPELTALYKSHPELPKAKVLVQ